MEICTKWWVHRCLKCQARKTSRQTVRWLTLPVPMPNSLGVSVRVDYLGPLPTTARGNSYILLFTDRFSRRADMFTVFKADSLPKERLTFSSTASSPSGAFPLHCSLIMALNSAPNPRPRYTNFWVSAYHPCGNGGVERVNHTMAQMLAMVCNERQDD